MPSRSSSISLPYHRISAFSTDLTVPALTLRELFGLLR
jgi:hypothetical protein